MAAVKTNIRCKTRKLYIVRYALTSEPVPPIKADAGMTDAEKKSAGVPYNFKYEGPQIEGYDFTLRTTRPGFIHIFLTTSKKKIVRSTKSGGGGSGPASAAFYVEVPMEETLIYIAYSPVEWTEDYWALVEGDSFKRMQKVKLNDDGSELHTGLFQLAAGLVVEEYRADAGGWLDSMRERLAFSGGKLFKPIAQSKEPLPEQKDEKRQLRWMHSGARWGAQDSYFAHCIKKPAQDYTNWVGFDEEAYAQDKCDPLLVAVYDAIGVGQDMATIHAADIEARNAYYNWYARPVIIGKHLRDIKNSLTRQEEALTTGLGSILWNLTTIAKLKSMLSNMPETGWEKFLDDYDDQGKAMDAHMEAFAATWEGWLGTPTPKAGSFRQAISDFDTGQEAKRENAFARTHFLMTDSVQGQKMAQRHLLAAGESKEGTPGPLPEPPALLALVMRGDGLRQREPEEHISDDTALLMTSFLYGIAALDDKANRQFWLGTIEIRLENLVYDLPPQENTLVGHLEAIQRKDPDFKGLDEIISKYAVEPAGTFTAGVCAYAGKLNVEGARLIALRRMDTGSEAPKGIARMFNGLALCWALQETALPLLTGQGGDKPLGDKVAAWLSVTSISLDLLFLCKGNCFYMWFPASTMFVIGLAGLAAKAYNAVQKDRNDLLALTAISAVGNTTMCMSLLRAARGTPKMFWIGATVAFITDFLYIIWDDTPIEVWIKQCAWGKQSFWFNFSYEPEAFQLKENSAEKALLIQDLQGLFKLICQPAAGFRLLQVKIGSTTDMALGSAAAEDLERLGVPQGTVVAATVAVNYFDMDASKIAITYYATSNENFDTQQGDIYENSNTIALGNAIALRRLYPTEGGGCMCVSYIPKSVVDKIRRKQELARRKFYFACNIVFSDSRTTENIVKRVIVEELSDVFGPEY